MGDFKESFWTRLGVFFGAYYRCPDCKFAHDKHQVKKEPIKRKFKQETQIDYGGLVERCYDQMVITITFDCTYQCPRCRHQWTEQHEEKVEEYEEDIKK